MPSVLSLLTALTEAQEGDLSHIAPLRPLIVGPQAKLIRHSVASEKPDGLVGTYVSTDDSTYNVPNLEENGIIDTSYSKMSLVFENVNLQYASKIVGDDDGTLIPDADFGNRINASTLTFADYTNASGTNYPQSSLFGDRGVKVGDTVYLSGTVSGDLVELWTSVKSLISEEAAASIGSATADADNANTQADAATSTKVSSTPSNHVSLLSADIDTSLYDGSADGDISETYTITVTTGGVAGVALLQVRSASGNDDYDDVTTEAFASPTLLSANRLLYGTFTLVGANPVDGGVPADEFYEGQAWTVEVDGTYTEAVATAAGTYTGTEISKTPTYKVTVTRGGTYTVHPDLDPPSSNPTPAVSGGGSIANGTYYFKITFTGEDSGETDSTATRSTATVSMGSGTLTFTSPSQPTGADQWLIYSSTTSGGTYYLQGAANNFGPSVALTSLTFAGTTLPVANDAVYSIANPEPPQIVVTRDDGADSSGPTDIVAASTAYAVGTKGVTISFSQTRLVKGDIWTIEVTSKTAGAKRTMELTNSLVPSGLDGAPDLNIKLFIPVQSMVIPEFSVVEPYGANWSIDADAETITVSEDIVMFDPEREWTVSDVLTELPVLAGGTPISMYLTYRQWLADDSNEVRTITDVDDVADELGLVDPDNPVAQAVRWALANTPGFSDITTTSDANKVKCIVLNGDPADGATWDAAIELITGEGAEAVYNIVPLSTDPDIIDKFYDNAVAESADSKGRYRVVTAIPVIEESTAKVNEALNTGIVLATLADNPDTVDTDYTYLVVPGGNGNFITNGVVAGDEVRYQFGTDSAGNPTYNTYIVETVESEDSLFLESGPDSDETTPIKVEIYHPNDAENVKDQIISFANSFANRRVKVMWPDIVQINGSTYPSYYMAASFAGLAGSVPGNQPLGRVEVLGPETDVRANYFTNEQLEELDAAGVFVVQQQTASEGGRFYCRHPVTTAYDGDINNQEEQAVRLLDAIGYAYLASWAVRYGNSNVTSQLLSQMYSDFVGVTGQLKSSGSTNKRIGSLLEDAVLTSLTRHPTLKSRTIAEITVTIAYPFNKAELTVLV